MSRVGGVLSLAFACAWLVPLARGAAEDYTMVSTGECECSKGRLAAQTYTFMADGASNMESDCMAYCDSWSSCTGFYYVGIHPDHTPSTSTWNSDMHANMCYLFFAVGTRDSMPLGQHGFASFDVRGGYSNRGNGVFSDAAHLNAHCSATTGASFVGAGVSGGCKLKATII